MPGPVHGPCEVMLYDETGCAAFCFNPQSILFRGEQSNNKRKHNKKACVFSAGVILHIKIVRDFCSTEYLSQWYLKTRNKSKMMFHNWVSVKLIMWKI